METARTTKAWTFTSLELFREDLNELLSLVQEARAGSEISIEDDKQSYPSLEEMRIHRGDVISYLRITNHSAGIRVELSNRTRFTLGLPTLSTLNATDEADLAFYRIKEFLEAKVRPIYYWLGKLIPMILPVTLVISGTFFLRHLRDNPAPPPILALSDTFALAVSLIGLILYQGFLMTIAYRVTFKGINEDVSFVRRNKDSLILSSIFFLLGILATVIFQYFK